jgi:hypothetical protein
MGEDKTIIISEETRASLTEIMKELGPAAQYDDAIQLLLKERQGKSQ